jgi:hypothetical protein
VVYQHLADMAEQMERAFGCGERGAAHLSDIVLVRHLMLQAGPDSASDLRGWALLRRPGEQFVPSGSFPEAYVSAALWCASTARTPSSSLRRSWSWVAMSMTVHAIASAPSSTARSAVGFAHHSANSG